ncbi:MAG: hypothetical protein ACP5GA_10470 [Acidithiobacillus sp.]
MHPNYYAERRQKLRREGRMTWLSCEVSPSTHEALRTLAKRHGSTIRETLETLIRRAANG